MPVRLALGEVGQPYDVQLLSFAAMKQPAHLARHPFGQIPTMQEGGLGLFESGAIVFHIADRHPGLLPAESNARSRAIGWMFAAMRTVEPVIVEREMAVLLEGNMPWHAARLPLLDACVRDRLTRLADHLADAEWLDGAFSAGDLLMVSVLRRLDRAGVLDAFPNLFAYVARAKKRPAFKRAIDAQYAAYLQSRMKAGPVARQRSERSA